MFSDVKAAFCACPSTRCAFVRFPFSVSFAVHGMISFTLSLRSEFTFESLSLLIHQFLSLTCMSSLMHNQLWLPTKGFPTFSAFTGFLSSMSPLLCTESWFLRESFSTIITSIGFPSWLSSVMYNELGFPNECLFTFTAFIGLLFCMHSLMYNES